MRDYRYIMAVPLSKAQNVTIISNKEMTVDSWRRLNRYLALQREIVGDEEAQGIEAQRAETVKQGSVHESPVANGDAPKGGSQ